MILVISPAKSLDLDPVDYDSSTTPALLTEANRLAKVLKTLDSGDLQALMGISEKLGDENAKRYKAYKTRGVKQEKRAINTFIGDVYRGLSVEDFDEGDYSFTQDHLRILSGLYGVLRPLDLIQPYRLEMGTRLSTDKGNNLYQYWDNKITKELNKALSQTESDLLVNLASNEYFKSVNIKKLKSQVLTIGFKEYRGDALKFISFSAKVARGMMARYIVKQRIQHAEDIKGFSGDGYSFSEEHSTPNHWLFVR